MCSTFKFLLVSAMLERVDRQQEKRSTIPYRFLTSLSCPTLL
jgi:hypothetical protein